jgi:hypothetical protein
LLNKQVQEWPTVTVCDTKQSGRAAYTRPNGMHRGTTLTDAAVRQWPTLSAVEYGTNGYPDDWKHRRPSLRGQVTGRMRGSNRARLNPRWVAQLMGYPADWLVPAGETN